MISNLKKKNEIQERYLVVLRLVVHPSFKPPVFSSLSPCRTRNNSDAHFFSAICQVPHQYTGSFFPLFRIRIAIEEKEELIDRHLLPLKGNNIQLCKTNCSRKEDL